METTILNKLNIDSYAKVVDLNCNGIERRRFSDLGIIKGTKLRPIFRSPLGDPTAYEIRKSIIVLRKEDAEKIIVLEV